jgi:HemY protein
VVDVSPLPEKPVVEELPPRRDIEITLPPSPERPPGSERLAAAERFAASDHAPAAAEELGPRRPRLVNPVPIAPAVIPLVHAPDDPGPEPEPSTEPAPAPSPEPPSDGWSIIRRLLKP